MTNLTPIELLKRMKEGDEASFNILFDMHWEEMYQYCLRVIGDECDTEDIVQDIFCKMWEQRENLVIELSLRAYLFGALRKKILKRFRDTGIQQKHLEILNTVLKENKGDSPLSSLIASDLLKNVLHCLEKLPVKERKVYILNQIDGYSVREISERFSTSEQTVRNQINNVARKIEPIVAKLLS